MMKLPHLVDEESKTVWVRCSSSVTAMGIPAVVSKYYPGYKGSIASEEYFQKLKETLQ
tara:strand:- start:2306 stop:2479 length:174 start_codon:yes stop_codon:yes gene_type:complete